MIAFCVPKTLPSPINASLILYGHPLAPRHFQSHLSRDFLSPLLSNRSMEPFQGHFASIDRFFDVLWAAKRMQEFLSRPLDTDTFLFYISLYIIFYII